VLSVSGAVVSLAPKQLLKKLGVEKEAVSAECKN
jgi:hypothetical protein